MTTGVISKERTAPSARVPRAIASNAVSRASGWMHDILPNESVILSDFCRVVFFGVFKGDLKDRLRQAQFVHSGLLTGFTERAANSSSSNRSISENRSTNRSEILTSIVSYFSGTTVIKVTGGH